MFDPFHKTMHTCIHHMFVRDILRFIGATWFLKEKKQSDSPLNSIPNVESSTARVIHSTKIQMRTSNVGKM